jgi:hypothetical protein
LGFRRHRTERLSTCLTMNILELQRTLARPEPQNQSNPKCEASSIHIT